MNMPKMADFFGTAAKARVRALEEALALERERTADLTRQLIAMVDTKAYRVLTTPSRPVNANMETKTVIKNPMDQMNTAAFMAEARDEMKAKN